jgi:flagellar protein FliO/FliZ
MQSPIWSLLVLAAVVASIPLALWVLKRLQVIKAGGQEQINLLHQLSVGTRERIAVIQVQDRQLLIGITPQHISFLIELHPNASAMTPTDNASNVAQRGLAFSQALARTRSALHNEN